MRNFYSFLGPAHKVDCLFNHPLMSGSNVPRCYALSPGQQTCKQGTLALCLLLFSEALNAITFTISFEFICKLGNFYHSHLTMNQQNLLSKSKESSAFQCSEASQGPRLHMPVIGTSAQSPARCSFQQVSLPSLFVRDCEATSAVSQTWTATVEGRKVHTNSKLRGAWFLSPSPLQTPCTATGLEWINTEL